LEGDFKDQADGVICISKQKGTKMKKIMLSTLAMVCCALVSFAQEEVPTTQKTETEWCTIEVPVSAEIGDVLEATVTLKQIDEGLMLRGDLHGSSLTGRYLGMLKYGGAGQPVKSGQTVKLYIAVVDKPDLAAVNFTVYISPDGAWANRVGDKATSAKIPVKR
jgi:hypothetical protein